MVRKKGIQMNVTKRMLCIALVLVMGVALAIPTQAAPVIDNMPDFVDLPALRRKHNIISGVLLGVQETSFVAWHDGEFVFEEYRPGFDVDSIHPLNSATKAFLAAMVGVAIQDGYLECITQPVHEFYPEATIEPGQEHKYDLTIEHVLMMRSGLPWLTQRGSLDFMHAENSGLAAFETRIRHAPGTRWTYCGGAGMQIVMDIIERASGRCYYEYIRESLFEPLGMESAQWRIFTQDGRPVAGMGLYMNARDMVRFGLLYLNDGMIDDRRVLPEG